MNRALATIFAVLLAISAACAGGNDDPTSTQTPTATPDAAGTCSPALPRAAGVTTETLPGGRTYILHVPPGYDGSVRAPLVLAFHGFAQFAEGLDTLTELAAATDAEGYVLALPQGTGNPTRWNTREAAEGADDVAFITELLDALDARLCIDASRTYAAGYSNGGGMALLSACKLPERFAAIGVVSATYLGCVADVPLIAFHGVDDAIVPFEGGTNPPERGGGVFPPVRRSVSEWARALGCGGLPRIDKPLTEIELSTFSGCRGGDGDALLYAIIAGGHTWPGGIALPEFIVGRTTAQIEASQLMVDFFGAQAR